MLDRCYLWTRRIGVNIGEYVQTFYTLCQIVIEIVSEEQRITKGIQANFTRWGARQSLANLCRQRLALRGGE